MDITDNVERFKELCEKLFKSTIPNVDRDEARAGVLGYHPLALLAISIDHIESLQAKLLKHGPPMCGRCYDLVKETFPPNCNEKPEKLIDQPIGIYHCPDCGAMIIAGVPHPALCERCIKREHPGFDKPKDDKDIKISKKRIEMSLFRAKTEEGKEVFGYLGKVVHRFPESEDTHLFYIGEDRISSHYIDPSTLAMKTGIQVNGVDVYGSYSVNGIESHGGDKVKTKYGGEFYVVFNSSAFRLIDIPTGLWHCVCDSYKVTELELEIIGRQEAK